MWSSLYSTGVQVCSLLLSSRPVPHGTWYRFLVSGQHWWVRVQVPNTCIGIGAYLESLFFITDHHYQYLRKKEARLICIHTLYPYIPDVHADVSSSLFLWGLCPASLTSVVYLCTRRSQSLQRRHRSARTPRLTTAIHNTLYTAPQRRMAKQKFDRLEKSQKIVPKMAQCEPSLKCGPTAGRPGARVFMAWITASRMHWMLSTVNSTPVLVVTLEDVLSILVRHLCNLQLK